MSGWNGRGSTGTWSIVLAGGQGRRLQSLTERWLGRHVPKQYCAFVGKRSMLQHTLDRARLVSTPQEIVTIVAEDQRRLAEDQVAVDLSPGVVTQPADRDTVAGIFLPLTHVRRHCVGVDAKVVIFPADHFVYPERAFMETVRAAVRAVDDVPDKLVILGVQPDGPESDYGWIVPGRGLTTSWNGSVRPVCAFVEKPSIAVANAARRRGGLWNTMVIAARAETLWQLGRRYVPDVVLRFEHWMRSSFDGRALGTLYRGMPRRNFSSELLQRAHQHVALVELEGVVWSDWGREERIIESLARLGARPAWAQPSTFVPNPDLSARFRLTAARA